MDRNRHPCPNYNKGELDPYLFQSFRGSSSKGLDLNGYDDCCCGAD